VCRQPQEIEPIEVVDELHRVRLRRLPMGDEAKPDGVERRQALAARDLLADLRRDVAVLEDGRRLVLEDVLEVVGDECGQVVTRERLDPLWNTHRSLGVNAAELSQMPALSICMVSLDCLRVVEPCLVSLRKSAFRDFEIIVVDNGSKDGTLEYLREQPDVRLIENGWNAGFTKATNQGIAASSGEYILWLNTDTVLREDSLGNLVDFLRDHPRAGVAGPKVLNADGSFQP